MNLNIAATPAAKIQILFNSTLGDVISGQGSGNQDGLYKQGDFTMFGNYTIDKGDYLFTLKTSSVKNLNWKKEVQSPGTEILMKLLWLNVVYNLKASVKDLLVILIKMRIPDGFPSNVKSIFPGNY